MTEYFLTVQQNDVEIGYEFVVVQYLTYKIFRSIKRPLS